MKVNERIQYYRDGFARNPNDRRTVLDACGCFHGIGRSGLAADILDRYLDRFTGDDETATLSKTLYYWMPFNPDRQPDGLVPSSHFSQISRCLDSVIGYLLKDQERFLFEKFMDPGNPGKSFRGNRLRREIRGTGRTGKFPIDNHRG